MGDRNRHVSDDAVTIAAQPSADVDALAREMYASYLESDFPEALVLGEHVVVQQPENALAHAVITRCRAELGETKR